MMQCWKYQPENRPTFSEVHVNTISYIEQMAGYLQMTFHSQNEGTIIANADADMAEPHMNVGNWSSTTFCNCIKEDEGAMSLCNTISQLSGGLDQLSGDEHSELNV